MEKLKIVVVSVVLVACSQIAWAQEEKKEEAVPEVELEVMVVTVTKTPINIREVPASVNVVTSEEIKLRAQTDNFYDAIRNVPGLNITYEGTRPATYIRGARPSILINGREMSQFAGFYHLHGGLVGMGAVDRIEVLKGPQSAVHGSKAISGVINVILKKGDKDYPYVEAGGFAGHGDQLQGSLRVGGGYDKLSYFLNVGAENQPEWETSDGTIPFTEERKQNIYSRFDYELNKKHTLSLEYMYNEGNEISGGKGTFYQQLCPWRFIYDQDYKLHGAFLSYQGDFTDWFSLYASFGLGENDYKWTMGPNGTMDPASYPGGDTLDEYLNKENVGKALEDFTAGEMRGTFNLLPENRLRAIAGVQYKDTKLDWTWQQYNNLVLDVQEDEMYIAPYLQVEYKPVDHALLTAGVRYDSYDSGNKDSQKTSPRVGLSLFPFAHTGRNWTTLWASYSEAFKAPQANQLYHLYGGNPDLKPEEAEGWEGGLKQRVGKWANLEFSYFDTDYKDQIIHTWDPSTFTGMFKNVGKSKTKGYEALLEVYPTSWLTLHFGYMDLDMKDEITGKNIPLQPEKIYNYGLTIEELYGFNFSLWGNQKSDWTIDEAGMKHPNEGDSIWNAKLLYRWNITDNGVFEPFISVENLTDEKLYGQPQYCGLYIQEERAFHVGATLKVNF